MSLNLDKSKWDRVRFGDVITHITDRVDAATSGLERFLAGEHIPSMSLEVTEWGVIGRDPMGPMFYKRFRPGDVLYVSRRSYLKKTAVPEFGGVTGEKTFVLRTIQEGRMLQEFLPFLLSSDNFHEFAVTNSRGSVNPYINWGDLAKFEFALPPIADQRRLSDLLWAAERHRRSLKVQRDVSGAALDELAASLFARVQERATIGSLTSTRSGPSFPASAVTEYPVDGALPVMRITNTKPDGTVDVSEVGYVSGLPATVGVIDEGSLVLIRTNGNRDRIGNVYVPPVAAHGHAVSAFQFLMTPADPEDRDYLYWVLKQPGMQRLMSESASGSTGLGNLAVRWLSAQEIAWPRDQADRHAIVRLLDSGAEALGAIDAELAELRLMTYAVLQEVFG